VSQPTTNPAHANVETVLGRVLTGAVLLSAAVAATGGMLFLRQLGHERPSYSEFTPQPPELASPPAITHSAFHGDAAALMQLGIFILVLTPLARVAFSLILFGLRRDRMYTAITLAVLAVLLAGLLGAVA
jgi:uncharacterized membrane protein